MGVALVSDLSDLSDLSDKVGRLGIPRGFARAQFGLAGGADLPLGCARLVLWQRRCAVCVGVALA